MQPVIDRDLIQGSAAYGTKGNGAQNSAASGEMPREYGHITLSATGIFQPKRDTMSQKRGTPTMATSTSTPAVATLTDADKLAIFREMQREARAAATEKAAQKAGVTVEELLASRQEASRTARYTKIAEAEGITVEEAMARAGTRRSSDGERKTLVSVSIPVSLAPDKQLERIDRSLKSLAQARETLLAANPDLAA